MAKYAKIEMFMFVSDNDPTHYHGWTPDELNALNSCEKAAKIIKHKLENNGVKVKAMYAIQHKGESKDEIALLRKSNYSIFYDHIHYHIVVLLEKECCTELNVLASYIGVTNECIEKPRPGHYTYDNMLSYLIHIKYADKMQYSPKAVITLAGENYMNIYYKRYKSWLAARPYIEKNKTKQRLINEVKSKMENGDIVFNHLARYEDYRQLMLDPKTVKILQNHQYCVNRIINQDLDELLELIHARVFLSWEDILDSDRFKTLMKVVEKDKKIEKKISNAFTIKAFPE